jgi:hypothetical protein
MRDICILSSLSHHLECAAYLLEMFKEDKMTFFIRPNSDPMGYVDFYTSNYKNITVVPTSNPDINIVPQYDICIKLTGRDDRILMHEKIVPILHIKEQAEKFPDQNYLTLSPYVKHQRAHYLFPVYKPSLVSLPPEKKVVMIGYYLPSSFDGDTLEFIRMNHDYTFEFYVGMTCGKRHQEYMPIQAALPNLHINTQRLSITELAKKIQPAKFVLGKKWKYTLHDRFSGQLSLAMSYQKPLLIDKQTKEDYNLPGFQYDGEKYCTIGPLREIDDEKYNNVVEEIRTFNDTTLQRNKDMMCTIIEKTKQLGEST